MDEERQRADIALCARGLAASREKARAVIEAGLATVNGVVIAKPAQKISEADTLEVLGAAHPYVGRGGLKLEKALRCFGVEPSHCVCMDIGASTGGFTDVLLQNGAAHVYAIDVGHGQLDAALASDSRVTNMEHTNARALNTGMFPTQPTLGVMDVSFISIKLILPAAFDVLGADGRLISLIKPQFEAGRAQLGKGGVISKPAIHASVLRDIVAFVPTLGWRVQGLDFSPISGGDGNLEFLADMVPEARSRGLITPDDITRLVKRAHDAVPMK